MTAPDTFASFDVGGVETFQPIVEAHKPRGKSRRKVLVCFRRQTGEGNPYVVPAFWIDSVRKCDCGVLHYHVTINGTDYLATPEGHPSGSCMS